MNAYLAWTICAVAICAAVGVACYVTASAWPLFALILIPEVS